MKKIFSLTCVLLAGVSAWAVNNNINDGGDESGTTTTSAPATVQAVDLDLPSGVKWASCNVGAEAPEEYGNLYAWGEVTTKTDYTWETYKYANGSNKTFTKYCDDSSCGNDGFTDNKDTLDLEDDAAHVNWGGAWRMPTQTECQELLDNCTVTWTKQNGVNGYLLTSKNNSNSIFLPTLKSGSSAGYYWSSSLCTNYWAFSAWHLYFDSQQKVDGSNRKNGYSVRPVCSPSPATAVENSTITTTPTKVLRNGQVYILRGDKTYTITGVEVK